MTREEFDAWMSRKAAEERATMTSPEFVAEAAAEFADRLRRSGWSADRIAAWEADGFRADSPVPGAREFSARGAVTGAEADIEANYPGGLAAFRRDERRDVDRTPFHKGEIEGY